MRRSAWLAVALVVAGLSSGCVTRRVLITSDPPGAIVYKDGQPLGPTPVEHPFVFYGKYRYRLVKDGYAPLDADPELIEPWYQWLGLDFVSENLIPFTFRDTQQLHYQLAPLEAVRHDDVRARAEELRNQGKAIGGPAPVRSRTRMPGEDGAALPKPGDSETPVNGATLMPPVTSPSPEQPSR